MKRAQEHHCIHGLKKQNKSLETTIGMMSKKIWYFGDRLRGDAAAWHTEFLENREQAANYNQLKTSLKNTFQDDQGIEN